MATKNLILGAFQKFGPVMMGGDPWRHPDNESVEYTSVDYWTRFAKQLDTAGFDLLFLADSYGIPMVDGAVTEVSVREGALFGGDPLITLAAVAASTTHLGLVATSPTTFEHPYATARRFSTLDHLSGGRVGWNVVTSSSAESAARMFGQNFTAHDRRYDIADEFLELIFSLWEDGWGDSAFPKDRESQTYAHFDQMHAHDFAGEFFRSSGVYPVEPSPQRTPVIFQAGTSKRGRQFAGRNAECVFVQGTNPESVADAVADIRHQATLNGRDPRSLKVMVGLTVITDESDMNAREKFKEMLSFTSDESAAANFSRLTGVNLLALDPCRPLPEDLKTEQGQTNLDRYRGGPGKPALTVREILDDQKARGTRGHIIVGPPDTVAQQIEQYVAQTDVDGFLVEPHLMPGTYDDFISLVMPELRSRGLLRPRTGSTLRERLFEGDPDVQPRHQASGRLASSR
ncbi:NtaA/DmoA family FMN-dependent monooxygenase [Arthrobacter sp. KNU40]|uniref:NtaA/DmoA family FMN-dependent monooxygenase n=1 Tax=Arthrobacter sp. KNU40 TaxID=3447965 RepID=UPI003F5E83C8